MVKSKKEAKADLKPKRTLAERLSAAGSLIWAIIKIGFFLIIALWLVSLVLPSVEMVSGNVAVVPIKGMITTGSDGTSLFGGEYASSEKIVKWIEKAEENSGIKAILLEINSPGGSPVATDEIVQAVKKAKQTKPVYSIIREVGASGAYWVASASTKIMAERMSTTGSIGVLASYLEFSGLMDDYNVTYQRLVSGKYKDTGSQYKQLTDDERALLQKKIDIIYEIFVQDVAANRNIPLSQMRLLADGSIYIGTEALQLGLVDVLGSKNDAIKLIESDLNITADIYEFKSSTGLFGGFGSAMSQGFYYIGRGIGAAFTSSAASQTVDVRT
jgi:protease-4